MSHQFDLSFEDLLALLPAEDTETRELLRRAYTLLQEIYPDSARDADALQIQHNLGVAQLLAELQSEPTMIVAGLLHNVLDDPKNATRIRELLRQQLGEEILNLIADVAKLEAVEEHVTQETERSRDLQELENLRRLFLIMASDDIRAIVIRLAAQLQTMRTLEALPAAEQRRAARETLDIFAPLANRLGIWVWKARLEDLAFMHLFPARYAELEHLLTLQSEARQNRVQQHIAILQEAIAQEEIPVTITGRPKHIYSIHRKMDRKNTPITQIYDTEGLRIVVNVEIPLPPEAEDPDISPERLEQLIKERNRQEATYCYRVLGIVHGLWTPVPGEFDDYIANAKRNGYQSLHTAVIGEDELTLEIQIRTKRMHVLAEDGVASHWSYKEKNVRVSERMLRQIAQMRQLAQMRQSLQEVMDDAQEARAMMDEMQADMFEERIYVLTPKGKVIELPAKATPIDFAYHVHTDIGHRCRGARVNGRMVTLNYQLHTGDKVEILTGKIAAPSRDWLSEERGYTQSSRTRQKIRQWFRQQSREENITRGRIIIEQELKRLGLTLTLEEVAELFSKHYQRTEDFLAAVGTGDVNNERIINRIEEELERRADELAELPPAEEQKPEGDLPEVHMPVKILGAGDLYTRVARCCNPLPGQDVIGYVTRGRGVAIHRRNCPNLLRLERDESERLIELEWGVQKATFPVQVRITAYERSRLVHDITSVLAHEDVNMLKISTGKRDRYNIVPIFITIEIPNFAKLERVLLRLKQIHNVIDAIRYIKSD